MGRADGAKVGRAVGETVGPAVGTSVGLAVGVRVGLAVGAKVGAALGALVGGLVGETHTLAPLNEERSKTVAVVAAGTPSATRAPVLETDTAASGPV